MNLKRLFVAMMLPLFAFVMQASAQDKMVTGKVTDAAGAAVAGVTIKTKGGKALGSTKADGTFSVKAATNATLEFTSVGFGTAEMQVPSSGVLNISLKTANDNLNEIVVIGYGTAKKKDLTGSVVSVTSKDFVKGALTTPEQLIAGKVAGVSVTPNGGAPGSGSVIRIRGGASLNASNDPLIVIDGVPLDNNGISGSANALNLINPNDIESFNILKDASAAAIYGSRASNGVIIITTKKGKAGKAVFNFSSIASVYTPSGSVDILSPQQFRDYVKANGSASDVAMLGTANTDWQKEIYKTSFGVDNSLSMTGAIFKNVPFRASLGYLNQQGILEGGSLKRTTASLGISPNLLKNHLKIDVNLKGVVSENQFANEGAIGSAVSFDPTQNIYGASKEFGGYFQWVDPGADKYIRLNSLAPKNPVGLINQFDNRSHVERSIGNVQFDYKFHGFEDLRAVVNLGYDVAQGHGTVVISDSAASDYRKYIDASGKYHGGTNNMYRQTKQNTVLDAYLNYVKESKYGRFDALVGYSYQNFQSTNYNFNNFAFDGTTVSTSNTQFDKPENTLISVYGRLNYNYKGKYFLTATARKDGSSRFSKANRWGIFPAYAAAWRLKEESFLKNVKFVNDLKIRAGYGKTGQQDGIDLYLYQQSFYYGGNQSLYQFGNTYYSTVTPAGYNANLRWETTEMKNIAVDFAIMDNRLSGTIEYYERTTNDLLNEAQQPAGTNFTNSIKANVGSMKNSGVELSLNYSVIKKRDITWDVAYNITYNKNEITNLTIAPDPTFKGNFYGGIAGGTGGTVLANSVGYARGSFYVYKQVYDEKTNKPIENLFEDINRDGTINSNDLYQYKQVDPRVFMGFSSSATYKKWSAGIVMRANVDNYLYNNVRSSRGVKNEVLPGKKFLGNASTEVLATNFNGGSEKMFVSNYWIENASFLRCDNINVGYNFGKILSNKADLRVTANVSNVFIITKYKGLDPEISGGIDNNIYKRPRVFSLGLNLSF